MERAPTSGGIVSICILDGPPVQADLVRFDGNAVGVGVAHRHGLDEDGRRSIDAAEGGCFDGAAAVQFHLGSAPLHVHYRISQRLSRFSHPTMRAYRMPVS